MSQKTMNGKSLIKVVLPVICGLAVIVTIAIIASVVSGKSKNPKIDDPKGSYAKLDDYVITNEKLYINMKYSYGVSQLNSLVDTELLKNIDVDTESEEYKKFVNELIYGENFDELTDAEKEKAEKKYLNSLIIAGYRNDQLREDYHKLEYRRYLYAKEAYEKEIAENDYDAEDYQKVYEELYADTLEANVTGLVLTFDSEAQALKVMKRFGIDTDNLSSKGWYNLNRKAINEEKIKANEVKIDELETDAEANKDKIDAELEIVKGNKDAIEAAEKALEDLEKEIKDLTDEAEINAKKAEIEAKKAELNSLNRIDEIEALRHDEEIANLKSENKELAEDEFFNENEVKKLYIDMYNYLYAYYTKADADYYDAVGNLKPEYQILKKDVHYSYDADGNLEFNMEELAKFKGEDSEEGYNKFSRFVFNADQATAINSSVKTTLFTSLKLNTDEEDKYTFKDAVKYDFSTFASGSTKYLALKLAQKESKKSTDVVDFSVIAGEKAPTEELKKELKEHMLEDKFDENQQARLLIKLRKDHSLKIFDHFIDTMYGAQYTKLLGTTLGLTEGKDFDKYVNNKKNNKTYVFTYKDNANANEIKVSAQQFFESLEKQYGPQITISMMNTHMVLGNKDFNSIYNPETGEIYDHQALNDAMQTNVKSLKYYFNKGYYASAGFDAKYGWENFLHDYLRMSDEKELVANLIALEDAYDLFNQTTYTKEALKEAMIKMWNDYFELSVVNLIAYVDYDLNGSASQEDFDTEDDAEQKLWTEAQMNAAKELVELVYEKAGFTGETGLYNQLTYVVNVYQEADVTDPEWGKYIALGLKLKAENAATYNNDSSIVEEFVDVISKAYHEIAEAGFEGRTFDAPVYVDGSFPTGFGYHKIAVAGTAKHILVDEDTEEVAEKQIDFIMNTTNLYKLYRASKNDKWSEENSDFKKEKLEEYGFASDYEFTEALTNALKYYYDGAIGELEDDNVIDEYLSKLRTSKVEEGKYKFNNDETKTRYLEAEKAVLNSLELAK